MSSFEPVFLETIQPASRFRKWDLQSISLSSIRWIAPTSVLWTGWCLIHQRWIWSESVLVTFACLVGAGLWFRKGWWSFRSVQTIAGLLLLATLFLLLNPVSRSGFRHLGAVYALEKQGAKVDRHTMIDERPAFISPHPRVIMPTNLYRAIDGRIFFRPAWHIEIPASMISSNNAGYFQRSDIVTATIHCRANDRYESDCSAKWLGQINPWQVIVEGDSNPVPSSLFGELAQLTPMITFTQGIDARLARDCTKAPRLQLTIAGLDDQSIPGLNALSSPDSYVVAESIEVNDGRSSDLGSALSKINRIKMLQIRGAVSKSFLETAMSTRPEMLGLYGPIEKDALSVLKQNTSSFHLRINLPLQDNDLNLIEGSNITFLEIADGNRLTDASVDALLNMPSLSIVRITKLSLSQKALQRLMDHSALASVFLPDQSAEDKSKASQSKPNSKVMLY